MKAKFLVVIEKGSNNYSAFSPDLPGCIATGKTVEKTILEMSAAIGFHLEGMIENGDELPVPQTLYSYLLETDEISANDILTSIEAEIPEFALA